MSIRMVIRAVALVSALMVAAGAKPAVAAEPYFVDLSQAVNVGMEDDGMAGNGQGGWSDEGANDMFIYPAIPLGKSTRNGYAFNIIDPAQNGGKNVIMLQGKKLADRPAEVTVKVPEQKGAFVYFLQNSVHSVNGEVENYRVATYTVQYADGSKVEIPVRDDIEIRQWWVKEWYANSGPASWPIFVGQNGYSMKWKMNVAVYAMQWANPSPDKAIMAITLKSEGKASPAIFAITIADEDYFKGPHVKDNYKRPEGAPAGYFDVKMAQEQKQIFAEMVKEKMVEGIRSVDVISPSMLAVTIDPVITGGSGIGGDKPAQWQKPEMFTLASSDDADFQGGKNPAKVGRQSYEYWNGDIGPFAQSVVYWHTYFLQLPSPMKTGKQYTITVKDIPQPYKSVETLAYSEADTHTKAIKINQVAYYPLATRRYAYLGWWAGDLGKVDFSACKDFAVIDEKSGQKVLSGNVVLRKADDKLSGEDVYEMDLSALKSGTYHILVPGLGRSDTFNVGGTGIADLYFNCNRAFFHQRCGQEFKEPYTSFHKDACHTQVYESGHMLTELAYVPKPNEAVRTFKGGYHDAADFDVFAYHLRATAQMLAAYEFAPEKFKDGDLNIPESGNKIPDLLDEADWALFSYRDLQQADGGVPLGRGNDQDAMHDWERAHGGTRPPFGLFPPTTTSSTEYAAVAAQYARIIAKYDQAKAKKYIESAKKAYAWAEAHPNEGPQTRDAGPLFFAWAAAELYNATGDEQYNTKFKDVVNSQLLKTAPNGQKHWTIPWNQLQWIPIALWSYIDCKQPGVDKGIQDEMKANIIKRADAVVKETESPAYRNGHGLSEGGGWGNHNAGGYYADPCLRAYILTKEQKYLDAACLNEDFQLGANPLSKTFITGMGYRHPLHPEISGFLYTGPHKTGETVKGITVYGLTGDKPAWYPDTPPWRRWRDLGNGGAEISSEFTITETIGASSIMYSLLYAMQP